jgi:type IV pilus assembly protein PilO
MPDLRRTRKELKTALAIMVAVDILAAAIYFSPLVGSAETRRMEMNSLQAELTTKTRQVAPLKDLPQKLVLASHQIADFYRRRFPTEQSQIVTELGKLTSSNGVTIETVKYRPEEAEESGLQPVEIEAELAGNYTSLARFINALERDQMFFIINSVTLGGQPQGPVRLTMKLETYLKAGT